jgi:hypothetical protein
VLPSISCPFLPIVILFVAAVLDQSLIATISPIDGFAGNVTVKAALDVSQK